MSISPNLVKIKTIEFEFPKKIPDLIQEAIESFEGQATSRQIVRYVQERRPTAEAQVIRGTLHNYQKGGKSGQDRFLKVGRALWALYKPEIERAQPVGELKKGSVEYLEPPKVVIGPGEYKIEQLLKSYDSGKILFNAEYQRSKVWPPSRSKLLMDSILRGYDINKIFIRQLSDGTLEVLDGQQRLRSIFSYLKDEYPLAPNSPVGEAKFSDLAPEPRFRILFAPIDAVIVHQADEETVSTIFLRLQEGMPLNSAEKLNAMRGFVRSKIVELSNHAFMEKIGIPKFRFAFRYLCAQVALSEMENLKLPEDGLRIVEVRHESLVDMYEYGKKKDPGMFDQINRTFNFLSKSLDLDAKVIHQRGDFVPIYLLASYLLRRYAMSGRESDFHDFVMKFLTKTEGIDMEMTKVPEEDRPYFDYKVARTRSTQSRKNIETGFRIILTKFFEEHPDIPLKDQQRAFDYGQRLAIYTRAQGYCEKGKERVAFDEAEFHHVKYHSKGGPTSIQNAQLLCKGCHDKVHAGSDE